MREGMHGHNIIINLKIFQKKESKIYKVERERERVNSSFLAMDKY